MTEPINTIVVDDEAKSRLYLTDLIREYCPQLNILGEATNIVDAKALIIKSKPDLLFLDIELIGGNAFDLLNSMSSVNCAIIFVTAYEQFALSAYKHKALDYLLKPVDPDDLIVAVNRVTSIIRLHKEPPPPITEQISYPSLSSSSVDRVAIPTAMGYDLLSVDKIVYIKAESSYSRFYLTDRKEILVTKVLSKYEELLVSKGFFRIHKTYLVNLNEVVKYIRGDGGMVEMSNGAQLDISARKKSEFLNKLQLNT